MTELAVVRAKGFAVNHGQTERDVAAVGAALVDPSGQAVGAISVSVPTSRFGVTIRDGLAPLILDTRREIERDIAHADL